MGYQSGNPLDFALFYAEEFGWPVFPCHSFRNAKCSCGKDCGEKAGKHPRIEGWGTVASSDPQVVREFWGQFPDANVGIRTGRGLLVIDVDPRRGGLDRLAELEKKLGPLPRNFVVDTGRGDGGFHIYARVPERLKAKKKPFGDGLDLLGEGSLAVAPPSCRGNGRKYSWKGGIKVSSPLPKLPKPWIDAIRGGGLGERERPRLDAPLRQIVNIPIQLLSVQDSDRRRAESVVENYAVTGPGETNSRIMSLCSGLKSIFGGCLAEDLEPFFQQWFDRSRQHMSVSERGEVWGRFLYTWNWADPSKGDPTWGAFENAMNEALPPVAQQYVDKYRTRTFGQLVAACRRMQVTCGDPNGVWFVSCRTAAKYLRVSKTDVNRWFRILVEDGVLEKVGDHVPGSLKAQRYRYIGADLDALSAA